MSLNFIAIRRLLFASSRGTSRREPRPFVCGGTGTKPVIHKHIEFQIAFFASLYESCDVQRFEKCHHRIWSLHPKLKRLRSRCAFRIDFFCHFLPLNMFADDFIRFDGVSSLSRGACCRHKDFRSSAFLQFRGTRIFP